MRNTFFTFAFLLFFGAQGNAQSPEILTNANNNFGINLYKELIKNTEADKSLIFSPLGISSGLVLAYAGAKGTTATQFEKIFSFGNTDAFHQKYAAFLKNLETDKDAAKITIANAVWLRKETKLLDSYADILKKTYQSEAKIVDFKQDRTNTEIAINTWVSQKTKGIITQLVPIGSLEPLTKLILTNTLYFEALWLNKFQTKSTTESVFFAPKKEIKMPFMSTKSDFFYKSEDIFEAVILPFQDMQYMTIILPKEGYQLKDVESQLTPQFYQSLLLQKMDNLLSETAAFKPTLVTLHLPRFKVSKDLQLGEALISMGLKHAFDVEDTANFSGLSEDNDIIIDGVIHNTYLEIDENGAKGASATTVVFLGRGLEKPVEMKINRPFLFFICDGNTGAILFQGRFVTPQ